MINEDEFFNIITEIVKREREGNEGRLTTANILNIATTIKMGSPYASEKNDYTSISNEFNRERYIMVLGYVHYLQMYSCTPALNTII